jgi:hypothetical protein
MVSGNLGFEVGGQPSAITDEVFAPGGVSKVSDKIWIAEYINTGCIVQDNHFPKIEAGVSEEEEEGIAGGHSCDLTVGHASIRVRVRSAFPFLDHGKILLEGHVALGLASLDVTGVAAVQGLGG